MHAPHSDRVLVFTLHCEVPGGFAVSDEQVNDLLAGLWYAQIGNLLRGQIVPLDSDGDGLPDYLDSCPHTPSGDVIDRNGCSIDDLCPCDGPWKNHGEYVGRFLAVSGEFVNEGLITEAERRRLLSRAADSDCGKTR